jgi:hypothetical protein
MDAKQKGISKFASIMLVLSMMAVLLGVGVFYWLIFDDTVALSDGAKQPIGTFPMESK